MITRQSSYFQYFTFGLEKFIDQILYRKRREIFDLFTQVFNPAIRDTILDVGVSDEEHPSSNLFEKLYPYPKQITAVGVDDFSHLERVYPGLSFVKADGRQLPFADNTFDFVYSHAVLEHTGSRSQQLTFLKEAFRVAKKGVFITTPNRYHPLEFHTAIPFLHYLPHGVYRNLYNLLGQKFYAQEKNLNLLTKKELLKLGKSLLSPHDYLKIYHTKFLFFNANLVLVIYKEQKSD